jgi:hypothetical protein
MKLILASIVIAMLVGYAFGGRLRNFGTKQLKWPALAIVGLAMQLWPVGSGSTDLGFGLLMASFGLLLVFGAVNVRRPGFPLIILGIVMNALVIGVNHGMPVSRHALEVSGQSGTLQVLKHGGGAKHHLATSDDRLMFLGDVIAIPSPVGQILSSGDVVTYLGVMWFVFASMRPDRRSKVASDDDPQDSGDDPQDSGDDPQDSGEAPKDSGDAARDAAQP